MTTPPDTPPNNTPGADSVDVREEARTVVSCVNAVGLDDPEYTKAMIANVATALADAEKRGRTQRDALWAFAADTLIRAGDNTDYDHEAAISSAALRALVERMGCEVPGDEFPRSFAKIIERHVEREVRSALRSATDWTDGQIECFIEDGRDVE